MSPPAQPPPYSPLGSTTSTTVTLHVIDANRTSDTPSNASTLARHVADAATRNASAAEATVSLRQHSTLELWLSAARNESVVRDAVQSSVCGSPPSDGCSVALANQTAPGQRRRLALSSHVTLVTVTLLNDGDDYSIAAINVTRVNSDVQAETNATVMDEGLVLDAVQAEVVVDYQGADASPVQDTVNDAPKLCSDIVEHVIIVVEGCEATPAETAWPPPPPRPPPPRPLAPPSPPPGILIRRDGDEQAAASQVLELVASAQSTIVFSGAAPPQHDDRLVVLPTGKERCDEAAFTWPSQGLMKVAGLSATLPALQTGAYKLCHCSKDDVRCLQMDEYWGNLGLTLLAVQTPLSPPSLPTPPSLLAPDGDATVPLTVLIAVIVVVVIAVAAGVFGAAWFRRRQGQVKRPRLATHKALAKQFDCFLSCAPLAQAPSPAQPSHPSRCALSLADRVAADAGLVSALYEQLTAAGIRVWWDKKCLRPAQKWEDGFVDGMLQSVMIVPVLSRKQLSGFEGLLTESACDNVLLEHVMMLELVARGEVKGIFPVMVGERTSDGRYANFFEGKGQCVLPPVRVESVGEKLIHHLKRAKKGDPISSAATAATVPQVLNGLLEYQGFAMTSDDAATVAAAAQAVQVAIEDVRAGRQPQRRGRATSACRKTKLPVSLLTSRSSVDSAARPHGLLSSRCSQDSLESPQRGSVAAIAPRSSRYSSSSPRSPGGMAGARAPKDFAKGQIVYYTGKRRYDPAANSWLEHGKSGEVLGRGEHADHFTVAFDGDFKSVHGRDLSAALPPDVRKWSSGSSGNFSGSTADPKDRRPSLVSGGI